MTFTGYLSIDSTSSSYHSECVQHPPAPSLLFGRLWCCRRTNFHLDAWRGAAPCSPGGLTIKIEQQNCVSAESLDNIKRVQDIYSNSSSDYPKSLDILQDKLLTTSSDTGRFKTSNPHSNVLTTVPHMKVRAIINKNVVWLPETHYDSYLRYISIQILYFGSVFQTFTRKATLLGREKLEHWNTINELKNNSLFQRRNLMKWHQFLNIFSH